MDDDGVIAALAAAASKDDPYVANVLATEALNRLRRATTITQNLGEGVLVVDVDGRLTFLNATAESLLGWSRDEFLGEHVHALLHCDCRGAGSPGQGGGRCPFVEAIDTGLGASCSSDLFSTKHGEDLPVAYITSPILRMDMVEGAVIVFRDIREALNRERRRASRHAGRHAVADILAASGSLREAAPRVLEALGLHLGWEVGCLYTVDGVASTLHCVSVWTHPGLQMGRLEAETRGRTYQQGEGLPGRAWASGAPIWVEDLQRDLHFTRREAAREKGLEAAVAFPIVHGGSVVGVVELLGRGTRPEDPDLVEALTGVGFNLGAFVKRMQHARALAEANALLEASLEATTDGLLVVDRGDRFVRWNQQFLEIWRLAPGDISLGEEGRARTRILDQVLDPAAYMRTIREVDGYPEAPSFDVLTLRDGRTIERYSRPQRVADRVVGRVWSFRDVTLRRRHEHEREEQRALLAGILENIADGVVFFGREGRLEIINAAAAEMGGVDREPLIGREMDSPAAEILSVDGKPFEGTAHRLRCALAQGQSLRDVEVTFRRPDGRVVTVLTNFLPVRDAGGRVLGIVGTFTDVTLARKREQELAASEARFRLLAEATSEAVLVHEKGVIRDVNTHLLQLFGYEREQLIGVDCRLLCAPWFRDTVTRAIATESEVPYAGEMLHRDGTVIPVEVSTRNLPSAPGARVVVLRPRDARDGKGSP